MSIPDANYPFTEVSYKGCWWLPENPDQKVPGELTFSHDNHGHIELYNGFLGSNSGSVIGERFPVIYGEAKGKSITIFGGLCAGFREYNGKNHEQNISFLEFWVGSHFQSKENVKVFEFSFGISHFEEWHGIDSFSSSDIVQQNQVLNTYNRPEDIEIFSDDNVTIFSHYLISSGSSFAQLSLDFSHGARIFIEPKNNESIHYYQKNENDQLCIEYYHDVIINFFSLMIGADVYDFHRTAIIGYDQFVSKSTEQHGNSNLKKYPVKSEFFNSTFYGKIPKKKFHDADLFFPYQSINNNLVNYVKEWVEKQEIVSYGIGYFRGFQNKANAYSKMTLAVLIFTFEGLHTQAYGGLNTIRKALQDRIVAVDENKKFAKDISLAERFFHVLTKFPYIFMPQGEQKQQNDRLNWILAQDMVEFRHDVAHNKSLRTQITLMDGFWFSHLIIKILVAIKVDLCGFQSEIIEQRFQHINIFAETNHNIDEYLKRRENQLPQ